jgi:hypothetical protein
MLHLLDVTSVLQNLVIFLVVDLQTIYHAKLSRIFTTYLRTNIKMYSSSSSLTIAVNLKVKEIFRTDVKRYFTLHKKEVNINCTHSMICYHIQYKMTRIKWKQRFNEKNTSKTQNYNTTL